MPGKKSRICHAFMRSVLTPAEENSSSTRRERELMKEKPGPIFRDLCLQAQDLQVQVQAGDNRSLGTSGETFMKAQRFAT